MTSIQQLIANVEAARQAVQDARAALADAIKDHAPHKVGEEFERGGRRYLVVSISSSEKAGSGWLMCRRMTSGKKWSLSQSPVPFTVED